MIEIQNVNKTLKRLGKDRKPAFQKAVFLISTLIESQAKKNLRKNKSISTGKLQQSIINTRVSDLRRQVLVGASYAPSIEFGRKAFSAEPGKFLFIPLTLRAKKQGWSKSLERGKDYILTKKVKKAKAKPFLKPAVESGRKKQEEIFLNQLTKLLDE